MSGSYPSNPMPTSVCCQAPWVNAGMEKQHFLYKPHLFYIRHTQKPQNGHFLASRKPARTINRMCLTCRPNQVSQTCILSPCGFLIYYICVKLRKISDWPEPSFKQCFLFLWEVYRPACIVFAVVTHQKNFLSQDLL